MVDDGRPLVSLTGVCLALSGGFALFQSATGHFLRHDTEFLQMAPQALCSINACRIVHFMFHDRVSFGGALIAIAVLYLWLAAFPLKAGDAWAWWRYVLVASWVSAVFSHTWVMAISTRGMCRNARASAVLHRWTLAVASISSQERSLQRR